MQSKKFTWRFISTLKVAFFQLLSDQLDKKRNPMRSCPSLLFCVKVHVCVRWLSSPIILRNNWWCLLKCYSCTRVPKPFTMAHISRNYFTHRWNVVNSWSKCGSYLIMHSNIPQQSRPGTERRSCIQLRSSRRFSGSMVLGRRFATTRNSDTCFMSS